MAKTIQQLLDERNVLARELDIHNLKGEALTKKYQAAVLNLQDECPHEFTASESTYYEGGFDYRAETIKNTFCKQCGFLVDTQRKATGGYC